MVLLVLILTVILIPTFSQETPVAQPVPDESELRFEESDEPAGEIEQTGEISTFGVWDLLRMVLVLALVAGAVYGVIALLKRRISHTTGDEDSPIRVLASRKIGAAGEVYAVMVGKTVLLLSGADGGIQRLATIEDQETIDELILAHSQTAPERKTFARALGEWFSNFAVPGTSRETVTRFDVGAGLSKRRERLRGL
jgi:flagellar biogenesis protein FliO